MRALSSLNITGGEDPENLQKLRSRMSFLEGQIERVYQGVAGQEQKQDELNEKTIKITKETKLLKSQINNVTRLS